MVDIIPVFIVLILIENRHCYTHRYNESIFLFGGIKNYCDMKCGDAPHTLCRDEGLAPPRCSNNFHIYELKGLHKADILMGLNGLRDRIADKMQVANMVILAWDEELSLMAQIFLAHCKPFAKNACANLGDPQTKARESEPRYYHVADNVAFRRSKFFPYHFVPSVLRDWYYEKNDMKQPAIYKSEYGELYGVLKGHNNFTRLANPRLSRVGCGIAKYHDGYAMLCYFFPYFQTTIRFDRGPPATNCPNLFPLKGEIFPNLCTNKGDFKSSTLIFSFVSVLFNLGYSYLRVQDVPTPRARGSDLLAKVELVMPEPQ